MNYIPTIVCWEIKLPKKVMLTLLVLHIGMAWTQDYLDIDVYTHISQPRNESNTETFKVYWSLGRTGWIRVAVCFVSAQSVKK